MDKRAKMSRRAIWIVLLLGLIFTVCPIIWVFIGAFKTNAEIFGKPFNLPKSWDFVYIKQAWSLGNFDRYLLNSAVTTIGGMAIVFLTACPAGYALAQMRFKGNNLLFYLFLMGIAVPVQAIIIPIFYQMKSLGLIDTLTGLTIVSASLALPFSIFLMRNSFKDIPTEMREAAYVDGAKEWKTFIFIMLPVAKPGVVALMVFTFMNIWNDFLLPLVLLISNENFTVSLGLFSFQGSYVTNYNLVFGGTLISMVPSILVYLIFQRQFTSGMSAGANK
ncbi:carbohydrate ABC transporter permease [Cohnella cellulosilytica]|uniref:Carbohydrate ABC transporter permease n=1 Tax=Cohnella cellulosilytica TaxID=986710 RepID=A0ABW2F6X6_9BACL